MSELAEIQAAFDAAHAAYSAKAQDAMGTPLVAESVQQPAVTDLHGDGSE
jgi:hypothetical protein